MATRAPSKNMARPKQQWGVREIEDLLIDLLAKLKGEKPEKLREALKKQGAGMPVDSLDVFDTLQEFHQRTGIHIPVHKLQSETMRSVRAFAEFAAKEGER